MKEVDMAAEWYFRRNKYEALMVKAADFGEDLNDYSGDDSDSSDASDEDSDSDYEAYRRKKRLRAKKKKAEKKKKFSDKKKEPIVKERQKYPGNEDEVAGLIRQLNQMRLDDPEYAPVYYKVMVLDQSGTAEKCVKPPAKAERNVAKKDHAPGGNPILLQLKTQVLTIPVLQPFLTT
ncbi:hypothetical protein C8R43DRAFT_1131703 [Mycena crocata]|nr:hypothetical protein C8R43DRAFT_1131703 [Mycena crocata]